MRVVIVRVLPRQGGKTTEMIRLAADEFLYIVCPDRRQVDFIWREAKRLGADIPQPVTWFEFCNRRYYDRGVKGFVIDNLDACVQSMTAVPVRAVTLTGEGPTPSSLALVTAIEGYTDEQWRDVFAFRPDLAARLRAHLSRGDRPWVPLDPDGLPPESFPQWREQEKARRGL